MDGRDGMDHARRIVLIDDSRLTLQVMSTTLETAGFDVRAVQTLQQFVNAVIDWKPHMIVTDLYMPEMSGAELCTWLRGQVATSRTPIVIWSSATPGELADIARTAGADAFVSKDDGAEALTSRLTEMCEEIVF